MMTTVKHTKPKIAARDAQAYIGIRTQISMDKMPEVIPQLIDETEAWLATQKVEAIGAPFIRYYAIDMENELDVEIGFPVAEAIKGDTRVNSEILPAGRYASLIYTDVTKGIEGNSVLIGWAESEGLEWDAWDSDKGHAFRSRIEIFIDGPDDDPDPTNWRTEVAIKLKDA